MTWPNKLNPITVLHMLRNLAYKEANASNKWRAFGVSFITGTIVGTPQEPKNKRGFRNLLNKAMAISPETGKPTLLCYLNDNAKVRGFSPPDHNELHEITNSYFVLVKEPGKVPRVAVNLANLAAPPAGDYPVLPTPTV